MEPALAEPHGIRLAAPGAGDARWSLRKRIGQGRTRQRCKGGTDSDRQSIVMKHGGGDFWIVRRDQPPNREKRVSIKESIEPLRQANYLTA